MKIRLNRIKKLTISFGICVIFTVMILPNAIGEGLKSDWNINSNWLDEFNINTGTNAINTCKPVTKSDSNNIINLSCGIIYGGYGKNECYANAYPKNHYDLDVGESAEVWASVFLDIQLKVLDNIGGTVRVRISWLHDPNSYCEGNFTDTVYHGYFTIKSQLYNNSTYSVLMYVNYTWPQGSLEDTKYAKITTKDRQMPPKKPSIPIGPTYLKSNEVGNFSGQTTDPDYDQIYYMFDWGEGENDSGWLGPYKSGRPVKVSKSWSISEGSIKTIQVRVKAKDIYGNEGEWSEPLIVKIIKNKFIEESSFNWCILTRLIQCFPILEKILNKYYN